MSTPIAADDEFQVNAATSFDRDDGKITALACVGVGGRACQISSSLDG